VTPTQLHRLNPLHNPQVIELDGFIEFFRVDPHYFERTFLLIPDNSAKHYALLRKVLEKTGLQDIRDLRRKGKEQSVFGHLR